MRLPLYFPPGCCQKKFQLYFTAIILMGALFSCILMQYVVLLAWVSPLSLGMSLAASHQLDPSCFPCPGLRCVLWGSGLCGWLSQAGCHQAQHIRTHPLWSLVAFPAVRDFSLGCQWICPSNRESCCREKANQRDKYENMVMIFKPAVLLAKNCLAVPLLQSSTFVQWGNLVWTNPVIYS